jgi:hypothetical protein
MVREFASISIAPTTLARLLAALDPRSSGALLEPTERALLDALRQNPAQPLTLRCVTHSDYDYQNPPGEDAPALAELQILQRLGLAPGDTRPAIELIERLGGRGEWLWRRSPAEMARAKRESVQVMLAATQLEIRPHHLMCMSCFFGRIGCPDLASLGDLRELALAEDNLCEAIQIAQRRPDTPIRLIEGPCMICPPCPSYHAATRRCLGGSGMALRDEWKDLAVLERLDLRYGDILPARELFALLYARIPSTKEICGFGDGLARAPEWRICGGAEGSPDYVKARAAGLGVIQRRG